MIVKPGKEKYPNEFDYYFMKSNTGQSSNETPQTKIECSNEETRSLRTIMGNLVRTLLDDSYMQQLLREQQQEKPVSRLKKTYALLLRPGLILF